MMVEGLGPLTRHQLDDRFGSSPVDHRRQVPEARDVSIRSRTESQPRGECIASGHPGELDDNQTNPTGSPGIVVAENLIGDHPSFCPHPHMGRCQYNPVFQFQLSDGHRCEKAFMLRQHH